MLQIEKVSVWKELQCVNNVVSCWAKPP